MLTLCASQTPSETNKHIHSDTPTPRQPTTNKVYTHRYSYMNFWWKLYLILMISNLFYVTKGFWKKIFMIYQVNIREQFWKFWGTRMWLFQVEIWQITSIFFVECKEKRAKKVVINYFDCLLNEKSPNGYHQCVSFVNKREHFDWFLESTNAISSDRNLERRLASHQSAINNGSAAFPTKNEVILEKSCKNQNVGNLKILKILERLENLKTISFCTSLKVEIPPLCIRDPPYV